MKIEKLRQGSFEILRRIRKDEDGEKYDLELQKVKGWKAALVVDGISYPVGIYHLLGFHIWEMFDLQSGMLIRSHYGTKSDLIGYVLKDERYEDLYRNQIAKKLNWYVEACDRFERIRYVKELFPLHDKEF